MNTTSQKRLFALLDQILPQKPTFSAALEQVYSSENKILSPKLKKYEFNISSGVSDLATYQGYLKQVIIDLKNHAYYRTYSSPAGNADLRNAIAVYENLKLHAAGIYSQKDICITEGATGGISAVFEWIKNDYPNSDVVIPIPAYYLFKLLAKKYGLGLIESMGRAHDDASFISADSILRSITKRTKLIISTQPNNPTGEFYSPDDILKILKEAKKCDIYVLFDELFIDLMFDPINRNQFSDSFAQSLMRKQSSPSRLIV